MDHLPTASPDFSHLEIPYLLDASCPFIYDNLSWTEYPSRVGWDLNTLLDGDFTNGGRHTEHQAASFLQAWLYFGMVHAVSMQPVDTNEYIQGNTLGLQVVNTQCLPQCLIEWRESISEWSEEEMKEKTTVSDALVKEVTETITRYVGWKTPLQNEVVLSIMVLHKTLMCVRCFLMPTTDYEPSIPYYQESREVIDNLLYEQGWCKRDIAKHHQSHSCLSMYFAISLGPRLVTRDHANCPITDCLALEVDESTYITQHARAGCDCKFVGVEQQQLVSIIESGKTPIVRVKGGKKCAERFHVEITAGCDAYVCITHVWADGLGNPHSNSLPVCQLELLQERVNAIYHDHSGDHAGSGNVPFWIDSLCVPVQPEYVASRKQAISSLGRIYRDAAKVLALDAELQRASCHAREEELALRISYSVWWSRLWTLQEGVFAQELWFQFSDGSLEGKALIERNETARSMISSSGWSASQEICYEGLGCLRQLYSFRSAPKASKPSLMLQAVNWRSSSKRSDESICLSTLFDLDTKTILDTPNESRLKQFILMQQFFPSIALFFSGAKMDEKGFRWAPKTFVFSRAGLLPAYQKNPDRRSNRLEPSLTSTARADTLGLHVEFFGFRLESQECSFASMEGEILFKDDVKMLWYTFRLMEGTVSSTFKNMDLRNIPNLAIVLPKSPSDEFLSYGVLVSVYREELGVLFSEFVGRITLLHWGLRSVVGMRIVLGFQEEPVPIKASSLDEGQKWCIG